MTVVEHTYEFQGKTKFFGIIPPSVRYSDSLSAYAKLLFAEITALCAPNTFCTVPFDYFTDLYNVEMASTLEWLGELKEQHLIQIKTDNNLATHQICLMAMQCSFAEKGGK